ncbi:MAG: hypothetical protein M3313_10060, partial [Actinomycetota bacterium]|nr:hypothetical protein [Actinomycetota bacterium]
DEAPEMRQFSFWLGRWEVFTPDGTHVGINHITPLFDGRVLAEDWAGDSGVRGVSLNAWDPYRRVWHQTWMDSTGSTLLLDGKLRNGQMVLEGSSPKPDPSAPPDRHRITWTPSDSGEEVRQVWETSENDGATWTVTFDGRYRRLAE